MTKVAIPPESHIGIPPAGAISQAYVRLRGAQQPDISVHHAHTDIARVTLTWGTHPVHLLQHPSSPGRAGSLRSRPPGAGRAPPDNLAPRDQQPYDGPAIGVDWTTPALRRHPPRSPHPPRQATHHPLGRGLHAARDIPDRRPRRLPQRCRSPPTRPQNSRRRLPRRRPTPLRSHRRSYRPTR